MEAAQEEGAEKGRMVHAEVQRRREEKDFGAARRIVLMRLPKPKVSPRRKPGCGFTFEVQQ
ncbi:hypothetical protein, partial [uncultured Parvibaculum sp.]|uniref:hypothetical protein n=1 Tax=uncultured Parvibaculum sp. TaxID=291828 RepID=UPI0030EF63D3